MRMLSVYDQDEIHEIEDELEFFASTIVGRHVDVEFEYGTIPHASMEEKSIVLPMEWKRVDDVETMRSSIRTTMLHESGHLMFSGDTNVECYGWGHKPWQVGSKENFHLLVNAIEDVRIEHLLTILFPQLRQMFIEEFERDTQELKYVEEPIILSRLILENKANPQFTMPEKLEETILELERRAMDLDVWNGSFARVVELAKEFHARFEKLRDGAGQQQNIRLAVEEASIRGWEGNGEHPEFDARDVEKLKGELRWEDAERPKRKSVMAREEEEKLDVELRSTGFKEMSRYKEFKNDIPEVLEWHDGDAIERDNLGAIDAALAREQGGWLGAELSRSLRLEEDDVKRRSSGVLDMRELRKQMRKGGGKLTTGSVFTKRRMELSERHNVCVLIDYSGSMGENQKLEWAKQAALLLAHALDTLDVNYSIRAFSARDRECTIHDIVLKEFGEVERFDTESIEHSFFPKNRTRFEGQNRDGDSIRLVIEKMDGLKGKKLLIVISDGAPDHGGTPYGGILGQKDTMIAIEQAELAGIRTVGVAVDKCAEDFVAKAYKDNVACYGRLNTLPNVMFDAYISAMYAQNS